MSLRGNITGAWHDEMEAMFRAGHSYSEIARKLDTTKNAVAGVLHRRGVRRTPKEPAPDVISAEELAEREQDQRDLDMLADLDEGHSETQVAEHWGTTRNYVHNLRKNAQAAA